MDQSFDRGEMITCTISLNNQDEEQIEGAMVNAWFDTGDMIPLKEGSPGLYTGRYLLSYAFPTGNQTIYVEAKKTTQGKLSVGFTTIKISVDPVVPIFTVLQPTPGSLLEIGQTIHISISANYPDGTPFEKGLIIITGPDGENITLVASSQKGRYTGEYTPTQKNQGNWSLMMSIRDAYGNQMVTNAGEVEVVESTIGTLIIRYWWVTGAITVFLVAVLFQQLMKNLRKKQFTDFNQRILKLEQLKKQNAVMYFTKGNISRETYDRLFYEYETKMARLSKKQRLLSRKIQKSKTKGKWWFLP
jgi:hypothetical protein